MWQFKTVYCGKIHRACGKVARSQVSGYRLGTTDKTNIRENGETDVK